MKARILLIFCCFLIPTENEHAQARTLVESGTVMIQLAAFNKGHVDVEYHFEAIFKNNYGEKCFENFSSYATDLNESKRILALIDPLVSNYFQSSIKEEDFAKLKEYVAEFNVITTNLSNTASSDPIRIKESTACNTMTVSDRGLTSSIFWDPMVRILGNLNTLLKRFVK